MPSKLPQYYVQLFMNHVEALTVVVCSTFNVSVHAECVVELAVWQLGNAQLC